MSKEHVYSVYILTNYTQTVLYIGITSDLEGRLWEHQNGQGSAFTKKYHVHYLLFVEHFGDVNAAIAREKELKGWTRAKKEALIRAVNPNFKDITSSYTVDACQRPEGPSRSLHSPQDDRDLNERVQ